jgi:uncharacterized repeat protein (TIGR01451 family)
VKFDMRCRSDLVTRWLGAIGALLLSLLLVASAAATAGEPQLSVSAVSRPTDLVPGGQSGEDAFVITVTNTGSAPTTGAPITITDELPSGLSAPGGTTAEDTLRVVENAPEARFSKDCGPRSCVYDNAVVAGDTLTITIPVNVAASPPSSCSVPAGAVSCVTNVVRVSGGGAVATSVEVPTVVSAAPAPFGISPGGAGTSLSSLQAGAHPNLSTTLAFNTSSRGGVLSGAFKDTIDDLPPGFALDLKDTPTCADALFLQEECPVGTQVGVTTISVIGPLKGPQLEPVYNLAAGPGKAAKIGFTVAGDFFIEGDISVRPGDYGGRATFYNATQGLTEVNNVSLTIWGVPADPSHDPLRWHPGVVGSRLNGGFGTSTDAALVPYFTNPTACTAEPLEAELSSDSWEEPGLFPAPTRTPIGPIIGCDRLGMKPALTADATTVAADAATGLDVETTIPQTYDNPTGLATSTLRDAIVKLPQGMTVNPSAGVGLGACSIGQFEEEGSEAVAGRGCPNNSKLGTVSIQTPLLKEEVLGSVFLAQPAPFGEPGRNPFNSLIAMYVVARIPARGIIVKVAGEVSANPLTGELVTTFTDLPPLPFSSFKLSFRQGATSPLVTPASCGAYQASAQFTPWATPTEPVAALAPPFVISTGFDGGSCPAGGTPPFSPKAEAGMETVRAGTYGSMDIRVQRGDGEQEITRFSARLPAGLTANLTGVPFCSNQAIEASKAKTGAREEAEPSCPLESEIGHTSVGAGVGSVLAYAPGKVYMAGPYHGAPFSIVAITSAKVGPFDLGTVVVREALEIDPLTAVATVDAAASDPIPHIIKGIVVHVRDIRVYIDRPGFMLNPTNCKPETFALTVGGAGLDVVSPADDTRFTIDNPFQVANCQALGFHPTFRASTSARTSRTDGASLKVKLTYPTGAGPQANISSVKVDLPRQLPSRLSTLQKACRDTVFDANPAACPAASRVGTAKAVTPILPVPLVGPAYFVSHGGAKFPELILVLQGYGITIELKGETFISKAGITSSTFRTVPDQPVTSFELTLPQGPDSALGAFGSLCSPTKRVSVRKTVHVRVHGRLKKVVKRVSELVATPLRMPTAFTAQNGQTLRQNTPIQVTDCPRRAKKAAGSRRTSGAH